MGYEIGDDDFESSAGNRCFNFPIWTFWSFRHLTPLKPIGWIHRRLDSVHLLPRGRQTREARDGETCSLTTRGVCDGGLSPYLIQWKEVWYHTSSLVHVAFHLCILFWQPLISLSRPLYQRRRDQTWVRWYPRECVHVRTNWVRYLRYCRWGEGSVVRLGYCCQRNNPDLDWSNSHPYYWMGGNGEALRSYERVGKHSKIREVVSY